MELKQSERPAHLSPESILGGWSAIQKQHLRLPTGARLQFGLARRPNAASNGFAQATP